MERFHRQTEFLPKCLERRSSSAPGADRPIKLQENFVAQWVKWLIHEVTFAIAVSPDHSMNSPAIHDGRYHTAACADLWIPLIVH